MKHNKWNITCEAIGPELRLYDVDRDGNVWPCKKMVTFWEQYNGEGLLDSNKDFINDDVLQGQIAKDSNWNNLDHKSMQEILDNPLFKNYYNIEGWNSKRPPAVCLKNCGGCNND